MKPIAWEEARRVCETLGPGKIDKAEALSYKDTVKRIQSASNVLSVLEATEDDMLKVRHMLACELHLYGRESMIYRFLNRHELLVKQARTQKFHDSLPAYTVWVEARTQRYNPSAIQGAELGAAVNNALFGKH